MKAKLKSINFESKFKEIVQEIPWVKKLKIQERDEHCTNVVGYLLGTVDSNLLILGQLIVHCFQLEYSASKQNQWLGTIWNKLLSGIEKMLNATIIILGESDGTRVLE